jgi:membrane associated rhomboid family serine protease
MRESRQSAPKTKPAIVTALRTSSSTPVVTYSLIGICILVYIAQLVTNGAVTNALFYHPALTESQPWRMITSLFVHSPGSVLHILFNMFSLFVIGPILEIAIGRWRFLALYFLSGLGGSVAVLLMAPTTGVLGASGAIFGLLGAFFVIQRSLGGKNTQIIIVIAINLALGFIIPNVAWQAHVGGLIVGGIVAFVLLRTRARAKRNEQSLLLFAVFVGLVVATILGVALLQSRLV